MENNQQHDDEYLKRFKQIQQIGEGSYGIVYKAIDKVTNQKVAIKNIRFKHCQEGIPQTTLREISFLKELNHPNVVKLLDVHIYQKNIYLVFEYMDQDLKKVLEQKKLTRQQALYFLKQLLDGIFYCHCNRLIHRDLKPQNLLIDENDCLKIADFGLARSYSAPIPSLTHEVVTLWYRSPEILLGQKQYDPSIDIWSIGCIYSEMLTNKPLFQGDSEIDQLFKIFQLCGTPNEITWPGVTYLEDYSNLFPKFKGESLKKYIPDVSEEEEDLLSSMLRLNPHDRLTAYEILQNQYFKSYIDTLFNEEED